MGNITYTISLRASKDLTQVSRTPPQAAIDWQGKYEAQTKNLSNVYSSITASADLVTKSLLYIRNADASNNVSISFDSGATATLELVPDNFALLPLDPAIVIGNVQAKATTATTSAIEYAIFST